MIVPKIKVLIVDDSRVVRAIARRFIEALGFAVDEAGLQLLRDWVKALEPKGESSKR